MVVKVRWQFSAGGQLIINEGNMTTYSGYHLTIIQVKMTTKCRWSTNYLHILGDTLL